ncbi:protein containing GntR, partial [mine drainage metagenome]
QRTTVGHLLETRLLIEPELARLAAGRSSPDEIAAMERLLEDMAHMLEQPTTFIHADRDFHLLIADAARNPVLELLMGSILEMTTRLRLLLTENAPNTIYHSHLLHTEVWQAIVDRKPAEASDAMRRHITGVRLDVERLARQGIMEPLDWPLD